jgi:hypothetical protein
LASLKILEKILKCLSGLPDGIFTYQKSQYGDILEGLGMDNAGR